MKNSILLVLMFLNLIIFGKIINHAEDLKNSKINEIFVVSNGWHTGFVIPAEEILKKIPDLADRFNNHPYIEFGWGDKGFYQSREFSIGIAISAIFWPTDSVIHSVAVPKEVERYFSDSEIEKICLSNERLSELIVFISNSFFLDKSDNLEKLNTGLYGDSQFYKAVDNFHLLNTCNRWTAKGLKSIGLEISTKNILTADSVMEYIKESKKDHGMQNPISCIN